MAMTLTDETETTRRALLAKINSEAADRPALEIRYGRVWNRAELARDFDVLGFAAPLVVVRRKADGKLGSLLFQHHPRYYFAFQEHK
jgi:hypothetical protein